MAAKSGQGCWHYVVDGGQQRVHFRVIKDDLLKMWGALREIHLYKRAGTRFNAYDHLFLI